ncbi:MAG: 30S ribosome-binding factor RbfA [Phycisphaerales bacterium JB037]
MTAPRRTDRVAQAIRLAVEKVLARGLADPRVRGLITVTKVTVDQALRTATIDVSVYPAEHADLTMHGLKAAAAHIRHEISDELALRRTPTLQFRLDDSLKRQAEILGALGRIQLEREARQAGADPDAPPSPDTTDGDAAP